MITYGLIGLAVVVAVAILVVAMQSPEFRITRSTVIAAPASVAFSQVNDFHKWEAWNPWGKIDPSMTCAYEGAPAGVGAIYTWVGNKNVGEGRMTILESHPDTLLRIQLDFYKPFAATNIAEFTFTPKDGATTVTWSMSGRKNFMFKAMHMVLSMDRMVGNQFDKGLADMKAAAESAD